MSIVTQSTVHARQPEESLAQPESAEIRQPLRTTPWWWVMLTAALVGIASGTITVVEKIAILKDPTQAAFCDFNDTIGCTPVLLAPQSSILGPPNAAIGIVLFGMFAAAGLGGVMGARYPRSYRWVLLGLAVFFGAFLTWYMWQVGFAIGSLCPFCAVCAGCVMAIVLASARVLAADTPDGSTGPARAVATARRAGLDVIVVVGWTVLIAGILIVGIGT
jgi:uncharacterized membrane protein